MEKLLKLGPGAIIGLILGVLLAEQITFGDTSYRASPGYLAVTLIVTVLFTALYAFVLKPLFGRFFGSGGDGGG